LVLDKSINLGLILEIKWPV